MFEVPATYTVLDIRGVIIGHIKNAVKNAPDSVVRENKEFFLFQLCGEVLNKCCFEIS